MAQTSGSRQPATAAVVRPLSRAAGRPCARPGCPSPSRATLVFRYESREAWIGPLHDQRTPEAYDLCANHADRTRPPNGWHFEDRRPDESEPGPDDDDFGGERTVAVLAAALHGPSDREDPLEAGEDADPLREALEELQAVALRMADNEERALRLVDQPEPHVELRLELDLDEDPADEVRAAPGARAGSGQTSAGDVATEDGPPGRPVPAAHDRRSGGAVTLW